MSVIAQTPLYGMPVGFCGKESTGSSGMSLPPARLLRHVLMPEDD
jgi:hypothetical protein